MRYGEGLLEEIRRRTDLVQLVGARVKLVRRGRVMWGCCPFHMEKSPSFKVENERRAYKCFGCGKGGDCFRWLEETEGLSFPEAVEKLAGLAGVELPRWSAQDEAREQQKKTLYEVIELAVAFYQDQLLGEGGQHARAYLKGRGLDGATARQFRLGYAPAGGQALVAHLTSHNVTQDDMIAAGLARPAGDGRPMRDFFFDRVLFPISDGRGRVIAFGGRAMNDDAKPKYINTGETTLFSKGHNLYNFHTARGAALKAGTIILAEGYMDVIALVRAGFTHAVAPLGTALTEDQLQLLWRTAPEPVLAFDGDTAGLKAGTRAAHLALPHLKPGHSLRFVFLPPGEDPDSLLKREGAGAMQMLLEAAVPLSGLLWRAETEGKDFSTPERLAGLETALAALAGQIGDAKIADYYRRSFGQLVFDTFKRAPARRGAVSRGGARRDWVPRPRPGSPQAVSPGVQASALVRRGLKGALAAKEMELGRLLAACPALALEEGEALAALDLTDPLLDRLRHELLNLAASGSSLEMAGVQTHFARKGMAELLARFAGLAADDAHATFHQTLQDLHRLAAGDRGQDARRLLERRKALSEGVPPHDEPYDEPGKF